MSFASMLVLAVLLIHGCLCGVRKFGVSNGGRLNLGEIYEDTLKQFTEPLKYVEDLSFSVVDVVDVRTGPLALNQVFPNLRRLTLKLDSDVDYTFLGCHFPHLDELNVMLSDYSLERINQIAELFRKNPQIRSFKPFYFPKHYAKVISKLLPNLENLSLQKLEIDSGIVRFEHLKHLTFYLCYHPRSIDKLVLPIIESLTMSYAPDMFNSWSAFFNQHQHLKRLHMDVNSGEEMDFKFVQLTAQIPNLLQITINGAHDMNAQIVTKIIQSHKQLMKFEYKNSDERKVQQDKPILQKQFGKEWNIKDTLAGLSFERK